MMMKRATALLVALLAAHLLVGATANSLSSSVQPMFDATDGFLDVIQPADKSVLLREVVPQLINGTFWRSLGDNVMQSARYYLQSMLGYSILLCFGAFLIIFVPLCGCCVCCCRCCCNNCGGKLNYMERKGAKCRWGVYGMFSLTFTTLILFGAILALVSNQMLREQLSPPIGQQRPGEAASSPALDAFSGAVADAFDTLTEVPRRGRDATPEAVSNVTQKLIPVLNATMERLKKELSNATGASVALEAGGRALDGVDAAKQLAKNYTDGHAKVVGSLMSLNRTLTDARGNLTVGSCPLEAGEQDCFTMNRTLLATDGLIREPESKVLTDLSSRLDSRNITEARVLMADAAAALANISVVGMEYILKYIDGAQAKLNSSQLVKIWEDLQEQLDRVSDSSAYLKNASQYPIRNPLTGSRDSLGNVISSLDAYRYYAYIGLATFALLLAALFYLGLLFGCIGEPPYEDSSCCNRGVGANFMLAGAGLGFLFYALIMIIVIVLFLPGALMYTEGCRYLVNRPGTSGWSMLDGMALQALRSIGNSTVDLTKITDRPVSILLGGCSGGSLGTALDKDRLASALNLPETLARFLNQTKDTLADRSADFISGASLNLSQFNDIKQTIRDASNMNFTAYQTALSVALPSAHLDPLLSALLNISRTASSTDEQARFRYYHSVLDTAVRATDEAIADQQVRVVNVTQTLAALNSIIGNALDSMVAADASLRSKTVLRAALDVSSESLPKEFMSAATSAMAGLLTSVLDCARLGGSLRQAIQVPCGRILQPFNGFWAGMGLCLMGLLPCLLLAIKLANIYRKTQKYLRDFDDGNPKPV